MIDSAQAMSVAAILGVRSADFRATERGQGRTYFASTAAGEPVLLKWLKHPSGEVIRSLRYTEALRALGYPVPRTLAHGPALGGYGVIQQRMPGTPPNDRVSPALLEQLLATIELQSGAGRLDAVTVASPTGAVTLEQVVHDGRWGWWEPTRTNGEEIARLYTRLRQWVLAVPLPDPRFDLVHFDLHMANVLAEQDQLTGIIDLDHLSVGDRATDLVSLAFHFDKYGHYGAPLPAPDVVDSLVERALKLSGRSGWRHAVAYYALHQLQWTWPPDLEERLRVTAAIVRRMMAYPD